MADDHRVDAHRVDRLDGVAQRLALCTEDVDAVKVIESAESRFAAVSKESRVRVELSKKTVATVWPRSAGTFGIGRSRDLGEGVREARGSRAMPLAAEIGDREQVRRGASSDPLGRLQLTERDAVSRHVDELVAPRRQVLADEVRPDRQLAVAAVDHDRELHRPRPAVVGERVERGPHGPAR